MWPERLLMPCLGITCVFTVQIFIPCMHGPFIWGFSLTDTVVQLLSFKHCMLRCMGHGIACFSIQWNVARGLRPVPCRRTLTRFVGVHWLHIHESSCSA